MPLFKASAPALLLFATLFGLAVSAQANELKDISQMINQGQNAQALDRLNSYLQQHPKDTQGQFLKGVALAEQNKPADAIKVFTELTEKHPELPEPYNNLAVLYADQGQYDKARHALEMAIKTHPSYATAHENLGDIYAKMASDAYDKALQLDKVNARAQTKLAMVKDLFTNAAPKTPAIKAEEPKKALVTPPPVATRPIQVAEAPKPTAPVTTVTPPVTPPASKEKPAEKPTAPVAKDEPKKDDLKKDDLKKDEPRKDEASSSGAEHKDAVLESVRRWAKAWSSKNINSYLDSYASNFQTPNGESRKAWEQSRKERILKPTPIKVEVLNPKVKIDGNRASVTFQQVYRAGGDTMRTTKTLVMKKSGAKWLIEQEKASKR